MSAGFPVAMIYGQKYINFFRKSNFLDLQCRRWPLV